MIVRSCFSPGQKVRIIDANKEARISGVIVTKHDITYMCRWWDGNAFQEDDFNDIELEALEDSQEFVMLCEEPKANSDDSLRGVGLETES